MRRILELFLVAICSIALGGSPSQFNATKADPLNVGLMFRADLSRSLFPAVAGSRAPTFSRSTSRSYVNGSGGLSSVSTDAPRFDYSGGLSALLIEPTTTNLCLQSQDFSTTWSGPASASVNVASAPDGTSTADKIVENAASGVHYVSQNFSLSDNTNYSISIYAKAAERNWLWVQSRGKDGTFYNSYFDLANGVVGSNSGGFVTSPREDVLSDGWRRIAFSFNSATGGSSGQFVVAPATGDGGNSYVGDGSSGVYVWQGQFETGSSATSPLATTTTTTSGGADSLTYSAAGNVSLSGAAAIWFYDSFPQSDSQNHWLLDTQSSSALNGFSIFKHNTFGNLVAYVRGSTSSFLGSEYVGTLKFDDWNLVTVNYDPSGISSLSLNGVRLSTGSAYASGTLVPATTVGGPLGVGLRSSGTPNQANCPIRSVMFWNRFLSADEEASLYAKGPA